MNTLIKSLGVIVLLCGVGILMVPAFTEIRNNMYLLGGFGTIVFGFVLHIFLNKKFS